MPSSHVAPVASAAAVPGRVRWEATSNTAAATNAPIGAATIAAWLGWP
jgi:hypothetical protein